MTLSDTTRATLTGLSNDLAATVERVARSVVAVNGRRRSLASGLAWTADLIVTAAHVLERDADLTITPPDRQPLPAKLVARDGGADLAILEVSGHAVQPVVRSEPGDALGPGHLVLAVGRIGALEPIASFGAISSIAGAWRTAQGGALDTFIRADVAMLPGLSGGALANTRGQVIGMLSAYLAGGDPVAIPSATLDGVLRRIMSGGSTRRAYLGISTQPVELQEHLRTRLGVRQASAVMVLGLEPGAPAERDGLLVGDILLGLGERVLEDCEALQMALGPDVVDHPTPVRVIRAGALHSLTVRPAARPS
ncbi:MAG: trypsin-like peptidase domain-containing protein [Chloroflexota bacterium]